MINEDGHWWQADKQTVIQTDSYGNQTVTQTSDGWFKDETTVTETDAYGNTTVVSKKSYFYCTKEVYASLTNSIFFFCM